MYVDVELVVCCPLTRIISVICYVSQKDCLIELDEHFHRYNVMDQI